MNLPGWKTSEFWLVVICIALAFVSARLHYHWLISSALPVTSGMYAVGRGLAKVKWGPILAPFRPLVGQALGQVVSQLTEPVTTTTTTTTAKVIPRPPDVTPVAAPLGGPDPLPSYALPPPAIAVPVPPPTMVAPAPETVWQVTTTVPVKPKKRRKAKGKKTLRR